MSRKNKGFLLILPLILSILGVIGYYAVESYRVNGIWGLSPILGIAVALSAIAGIYYLMVSD